jgi:hypothetical protein
MKHPILRTSFHIHCQPSTSYYVIKKRHTAEELVEGLEFNFLTSRSRNFHSCGDVTIVGEGLQNLDLSWALKTFEQGEILDISYHINCYYVVSLLKTGRSIQ